VLPAGVPSAVAVFQMAGIAIRAPMAKKTAAMTTLGNCIAILQAKPVGGCASGRAGGTDARS
jgi:hypothetical protein